MFVSRYLTALVSLLILLPSVASAQRLIKIDPQDIFQTEDSRGKVLTCAFVEAQDEWLPGKIVRSTFFRPERRPKGKKALAGFRERLALCAEGPDDDGEDGDDSNRGPGGGGSGGGNPTPPAGGGLSRLATAVRVKPGVEAPAAMAILAGAQVERGCLAVWEASRQAGAPRGTGTLTQTSVVPLIYQYSAQPTDRLRVVQLDGTRYEFFFQRVEGDLNVDAITFLSGERSVALRAVVVGESDLQIETTQRNGIHAGRVAGTYMYDGRWLTGEIIETGTYVLDRDLSGFFRQDRSTYTGSITGENLAIQVSETIEGEGMGGRRLYAWQTWGNVRRFIASRWTTDGLTFSIHDALVRSSFQNGAPALVHDPEKWSAQGQLRVDGQAAGVLGMEVDRNKIEAKIDLAAGAVEVQKWNR